VSDEGDVNEDRVIEEEFMNIQAKNF